MNDLLQETIEHEVPLFKRYALELLQVFNDGHSWENKSNFPIFHLMPKEYYLQQYFAERLEGLIRKVLINDVLNPLLLNENYNVKFFEHFFDDSEQFGLNYWSNNEYEQNVGFEFIETKVNKTIGFRYTSLPVTANGRIKLLDIINQRNINEIVVINWSIDNAPDDWTCKKNPYFPNISIRSITIKDFFIEYFDEETYARFIQYVNDTVQGFQEYIGVVSIPRLTSSVLFKFRFEVEHNLLNHFNQLEWLCEHWRNNPSQSSEKYGYRFIDPSNDTNKNYHNLENRSLALLFNTRIMRTYKDHNYYQALIGKSSFARCLITSEYLYKNYGRTDQFDFTAVVSGYLKSIEQLLYNIALFSIDKKDHTGQYYQIAPKTGNKHQTVDFTTENLNNNLIDTTLGALCFFFKNNKDLVMINGPYKTTLINCCFCYSEECRNDNFHKHNISQWDRVEIIRHNTFFMYLILLGCCRLGENYEDTAKHLGITTDDKLSRIYYQLTNNDQLDYVMEFENGKVYEICQPRLIEYPALDEYGLLKDSELKLECESAEYSSLYDGTKYITISKNHIPKKIWYYDDDRIKHYFEY